MTPQCCSGLRCLLPLHLPSTLAWGRRAEPFLCRLQRVVLPTCPFGELLVLSRARNAPLLSLAPWSFILQSSKSWLSAPNSDGLCTGRWLCQVWLRADTSFGGAAWFEGVDTLLLLGTRCTAGTSDRHPQVDLGVLLAPSPPSPPANIHWRGDFSVANFSLEKKTGAHKGRGGAARSDPQDTHPGEAHGDERLHGRAAGRLWGRGKAKPYRQIHAGRARGRL